MISEGESQIITSDIKKTSHRTSSGIEALLLVLFATSCFGYFATASFHEFWTLIIIQTFQYVIYFLMAYFLIREGHLSLRAIVTVGILARMIIMFSTPVLEDDYWRYLWDARVGAHGINPYLFSPLDSALDFLKTDYRSWIGWSQFSTIYPPFAQVVLTISHFIAPDSLMGLKIIFVSFDVATGFLLIKWLKKKNENMAWSFLYWLSPLVLKEISNSAHMDSIAIFFSMLAIYLFPIKRYKDHWAYICLALATGIKLYPLVLLPLFLRLDSKWKSNFLIYFGVLLSGYLFYSDAGLKLFVGTTAYGKFWLFNASLFHGFSYIINFIVGSELLHLNANDILTKILVGIIFLAGLTWQTKNLKLRSDLSSASLFTLGFLLILSPVVDAWYVLWLFPLAVLRKNVPWLSFSYLVLASYSWFFSKDMALFFRAAEYLIFFGILLYYWQFKWKSKISL